MVFACGRNVTCPALHDAQAQAYKSDPRKLIADFYQPGAGASDTKVILLSFPRYVLLVA